MMKKGILAGLSTLASLAAMAEDNGDLVKRGEYLARASDCVACHTAKGGKPFAGGLPIASPIGTIYSTNITPDTATGIGNYSFDDFKKAVRHGVAKNGDALYPAMPYPSFAVISDEDLHALYAYFRQSVTAVNQPNQTSDIPWPLSMRWPLAIWRKMFVPEVKPMVSVAQEDPVVARGRYLVEGPGHCGACHTPRRITMQEKVLNGQDNHDYLAGSNAPIDGWTATNLRGDNRDGLGRWSEQDIAQLLRYGRNDHTAVFGGMTDVIEHSLQYLTDEDITAIARYLKTLSPRDPQQKAFSAEDTVAKALWKGDNSKTGAGVYVDNCAACHKTDGSGYQRIFPALQGNSVLLADDPTSLIHVVLNGTTLPGVKGAPSEIHMPAFGWRLNDQQVADVVNFIRSSWGNDSQGHVFPREVAKLRQSYILKDHPASSEAEKLQPPR